MSAFRDIMSIVGPGGAKTTASPKPAQPQPTGASRPTPRPAAGTNGTTPAPQLKRKASGPVDSSQVKVQRKDSPAQPVQYTGTARPVAAPGPGAARLSQSTTTTVPYRGTAAPSSTKLANPIVKKPAAPASTVVPPRKATPPVPKPAPAPAVTASSAAAPASKPKGYLALLQKAKEKDATKPAAPPVTVAPKGLILTKKERLALKAEAMAAKGKKPGVVPAAKAVDVRSDAPKMQKKPADVGYQGTARPAKTAAPIGYKGTARPQTTAGPSSRGSTPAAKSKPKPEKGRYDGYADWSDLDDMEDEDDYASDASSDMEGGIWDVEQEEQLALKAAKKEDAEALAEEMRLKREKEEKKRKLMALSKAAAAKKRY